MSTRTVLGKAPAIPVEFWSTTETLECLADRNVGHMFRLIQKVSGATQTHIGIATSLSQAQVSEIMASKRRVASVDVLARIVEGFSIPDPARTVLLMGSLDYALATPSITPAAEVELLAESLSAVDRYAGVSAIYATRSDFMTDNPPHVLLSGASRIRAAGLSLNLICQQYAERSLLDRLRSGMQMQCLFLDPEGQATSARDREEGYSSAGVLASLTRINIEVLSTNVRDRLPAEQRANIELAVYDETIRFNLLFIDDRLCIAQPYLPSVRGIESPTLIIEADSAGAGIYQTFERVYTDLWERSQPI